MYISLLNWVLSHRSRLQFRRPKKHYWKYN